MTTVYLYGGEGEYSGAEKMIWRSPVVGSTHKFICFIAQAEDVPRQGEAVRTIETFGFSHVKIGEGKPIHVEVLNEPQMQVFQKHYEGALESGFSLVWYP